LDIRLTDTGRRAQYHGAIAVVLLCNFVNAVPTPRFDNPITAIAVAALMFTRTGVGELGVRDI
jgi:hypothetical protein